MMALAAVFPLGIDGHHVHRSQFPVVCQVTRGRDRQRGREGQRRAREQELYGSSELRRLFQARFTGEVAEIMLVPLLKSIGLN